jgi:hypothetical protein
MMIKEKNMIKKAIFTLPLSLVIAMSTQTLAQDGVPTLIVTNKPIAQVAPQTVPSTSVSPTMREDRRAQRSDDLYSKPVRLPDIKADSVLNPNYFAPVDTMTAQKIKDIQTEMYNLQAQVADSASQLQSLETVGQDLAANYYAAIATINTQLQSGTTPGNPRLKNRLVVAEDALDTLSGNVADLNKMAVQVADLASVSNFLQQESRAAYGLSGSVEEDHVALAQLEDSIANTATAIERLLNNVNDNITRAAAYMGSERSNLRTLALAISNGDLYGTSLSNRPFSMAQGTDILEQVSYSTPIGQARQPRVIGKPATPRPLMKIRFDRPDVDYSQALYMSVNDAMKQYPNTQFELVAVSPGMGNPAKLAIESTRARRNAEKVLRNMVQMGVDTNRVNLANLTEDNIQYNEVHLYIR